jgi:hypothetical protein
VGDSLLVQSQATGFLTLDEIPPGRDLWLLSTGTAIGPSAMLAEGQVFDRFEHLVLVHGVRKGKSSAISRLSPVLPSSMASVFAMFPSSVVRPGRRRWQGDPGSHRRWQLAGEGGAELLPELSQVMICGNPAMVKETQQTLLGLGLAKNLRRAPAISAWKTTGRGDDSGATGPQPCPWACWSVFLVAVAAVLVLGLVMALTRVVATVNAAVVMVAVFAIHVVAVELDAAGPVLTSRQLCCHHSYSLSSQSGYPALVGGDPDVVIVLEGGSKGHSLNQKQGEQQCAAGSHGHVGHRIKAPVRGIIDPVAC